MDIRSLLMSPLKTLGVRSHARRGAAEWSQKTLCVVADNADGFILRRLSRCTRTKVSWLFCLWGLRELTSRCRSDPTTQTLSRRWRQVAPV